MPPLPTLVCKECGYVNEGERIYCHGCGVKLDREAIAVQQRQQPAPSMAEKQREVKRIMTPRNRTWRATRQRFYRSILAAAFVAAIINAVRPPEGAQPIEQKKELVDALPLDEFLEKITTSPTVQRRAVGEKEINTYLKKERFRKVPAWFTGVIPLRGVYVRIENGSGILTVSASPFNYPFYAGLTGYFETEKGTGPVPVCTGGFIGRLPIHPALAAYAGQAIPLVLGSVKREIELLGKLESIELYKGQAVVTSRKPATAPVAPAAPNRPSPAPPGRALMNPVSYFCGQRSKLALLAAVLCAGVGSGANAVDPEPLPDTPPPPLRQTTPGFGLMQRSISQSGQFIVYGSDIRLRLSVTSYAETVKRDVMEMLGLRDHWKMPIVVTLRRPGATDSTRQLTRVQLIQTDGGWKVDVDAVLRDGEFKQVRFPQLIVRAILTEMAYREHPPEIGAIYPEPPSWLVEGITQNIQRRATGAAPNGALFRQLIETGRIPKIADFLKSNVAAMDATSLAVHGAFASSLVDLLVDTPGGQASLVRMIKGLPDYDRDPVATLLQYFSVLGSPAALEKWWTLGLARYSTADSHNALSIPESNARLTSLLTITVVTDEKKNTRADFPLEDYKAMLKHPGAKPALYNQIAQFGLLTAQAHPLLRPVVQEYQRIAMSLAQGKTRGAAEALRAIADYRSLIVERMDKIDDYLNWYEATQMPEQSGAFADFMQNAKALEKQPPPKRNDAISKYIDQLQREFE